MSPIIGLRTVDAIGGHHHKRAPFGAEASSAQNQGFKNSLIFERSPLSSRSSIESLRTDEGSPSAAQGFGFADFHRKMGPGEMVETTD